MIKENKLSILFKNKKKIKEKNITSCHGTLLDLVTAYISLGPSVVMIGNTVLHHGPSLPCVEGEKIFFLSVPSLQVRDEGFKENANNKPCSDSLLFLFSVKISFCRPLYSYPAHEDPNVLK